MLLHESCFKSLSEVLNDIYGKKCYLDPSESDLSAKKQDSFIIYDEDGDVLYRYLKDKKCFYKNSPAYQNNRPKRNVKNLMHFTNDDKFNWALLWPSK